MTCLCGYFCIAFLCVGNAQARPFVVFGQAVVEPSTALKLPGQLVDAGLLDKYQFEQVIPIVLGLILLVLAMFVLERHLKERLLRKFLEENQTLKNQAESLDSTNNFLFLVGIILLLLSVALYHFVLAPRLLYQNQQYVKYFSEGLIILALMGGHLFGSYKRSKQVELLVSNLQRQIKSKLTVQNKLELGERRLSKQQAALATLTHSQLEDWQEPEEIFREITEISAETLEVDRVSVWMFSEDHMQLECVDLYIRSKNLHTVEKPLQAGELPVYFSHLEKHRVIAANDVMQDPATVEFTHSYVQENNIGALLDGTIWLNNQIVGVICHEHVDGPREWTLDEQSFAGSVADLARLTIETDRRRDAERALLRQNEDLEKIVEARTLLLQESQKTFEYVVKNAPISIAIINTEGTLLEFNPELERLTGFSREEVIGKNFVGFMVAKESRRNAVMAAKDALDGKAARSVDLMLNCANGGTIELQCTSSVPTLDTKTGLRQMVAIGQDVSQQKVLQASMQKLLDSEKRFSYVVKYAPIPILILNNKGDIVEANPEAQISSGFAETIVGKNFIELIVSDESRKKAIVTAAHAMKGKDFRNVELTLQNADGAKVEYECSLGSVIQNVEEGQSQVVAIARNVSSQKALQASLIKAREAAESADRIKSMFVASMSHELRTPLNSIIGFLGVVLQGMSGELNAKQKDQLGRAYHSAKHLLSLISDVIDISKIEAGFLNVYSEEFELRPLLNEVEHAVQHIVEEKHLQLTINCADQLILETDRKRLYQVVLNVVSNAVKYTEQGTVEVKAVVKNGQLIISTADTGIGIDEAGLANLFKPFERVDSRLRIKTLGTGLGLYLTRKILTQLLGGTIEVKSKPEEGSTFTIHVPTKIPPQIMQSNSSILEG